MLLERIFQSCWIVGARIFAGGVNSKEEVTGPTRTSSSFWIITAALPPTPKSIRGGSTVWPARLLRKMQQISPPPASLSAFAALP